MKLAAVLLWAHLTGWVLAHALYQMPIRPMLRLWFRLPDKARHDAATAFIQAGV